MGFYHGLLIIITSTVDPTFGETTARVLPNLPTNTGYYSCVASFYKEIKLGESIDPDASVIITVNTTTNTGYYSCVASFYKSHIYDKLVVTAGECRVRRMSVLL